MVLNLELQPDLEQRLRREAGRQGLDARSFVLDLLRQTLNRPETTPETMSEKELISEINRGLTEEEWARYHELVDKRREETLTGSEHQELTATTTRLEEANVFRIQCLGQLARRRQVSLTELLDQLGIRPTIYG